MGNVHGEKDLINHQNGEVTWGCSWRYGTNMARTHKNWYITNYGFLLTTYNWNCTQNLADWFYT
jgi:hypothetical protein